MSRWIVLSLAACLATACGSSDAGSKSASPSADTAKASSTGPTPAPAPAPALKTGDVAPAFSLQGSDGRSHALADHAGKEAVVVAWFPKAFTGG